MPKIDSTINRAQNLVFAAGKEVKGDTRFRRLEASAKNERAALEARVSELQDVADKAQSVLAQFNQTFPKPVAAPVTHTGRNLAVIGTGITLGLGYLASIGHLGSRAREVIVGGTSAAINGTASFFQSAPSSVKSFISNLGNYTRTNSFYAAASQISSKIVPNNLFSSVFNTAKTALNATKSFVYSALNSTTAANVTATAIPVLAQTAFNATFNATTVPQLDSPHANFTNTTQF